MRLKFSLVVFIWAINCAILATCRGSWPPMFTKRIIPSEPVSHTDFPYLVTIGKTRARKDCVGIRLSNNAILTPAACLDYSKDTDGLEVRVRFGFGHEDYEVERVVLEKVDEYHTANSPTRYAVLKLREKIDDLTDKDVDWETFPYGHTDDYHCTIGFGWSLDDELAKAGFKVTKWGESMFIKENKVELVSSMGSPVLTYHDRRYYLVGFVSFRRDSREALYRVLSDELQAIRAIVRKMSKQRVDIRPRK